MRIDRATFATITERVHACVTLSPPIVPLTAPSPWADTFRALRPGAHVAAVCPRGAAVANMIALRLAGFQIRDVIEVMRYDRGAVILARKPTAGTIIATVQAHEGCAALNIERSKIDATGRWPANVTLDGEAGKAIGAVGRFFTRTDTEADLLLQLACLVCPVGAVIVDPFAASDAVEAAATAGGFAFVGVA